jgi:hypothetical protein
MEFNILKINTNKLQITLTDGSVWMLTNVGDISKISIWYPTQRIEVEEENGEYTLCNLDTYETEKIQVSRIA